MKDDKSKVEEKRGKERNGIKRRFCKVGDGEGRTLKDKREGKEMKPKKEGEKVKGVEKMRAKGK